MKKFFSSLRSSALQIGKIFSFGKIFFAVQANSWT